MSELESQSDFLHDSAEVTNMVGLTEGVSGDTSTGGAGLLREMDRDVPLEGAIDTDREQPIRDEIDHPMRTELSLAPSFGGDHLCEEHGMSGADKCSPGVTGEPSELHDQDQNQGIIQGNETMLSDQRLSSEVNEDLDTHKDTQPFRDGILGELPRGVSETESLGNENEIYAPGPGVSFRRHVRTLSRDHSVDLEHVGEGPSTSVSLLTLITESVDCESSSKQVEEVYDGEGTSYSPEHLRPHLCECHSNVASDAPPELAQSCVFCTPPPDNEPTQDVLDAGLESGYQPSWCEQVSEECSSQSIIAQSHTDEAAPVTEETNSQQDGTATLESHSRNSSSQRRVSFSQTHTNSLSVDPPSSERRLSAPSTISDLGAGRLSSTRPLQGRFRHRSGSPVVALPLEECLQDLETQVVQQGIERPTVLTLVHSHSIAEIDHQGESPAGSGSGSRRQSLTPEAAAQGECDGETRDASSGDVTPEQQALDDRATPPPTYEQCMKQAVQLSFMDFWPQCLDLQGYNFTYARFETFDHVMEAANRWLRQHPGIIIKNCETIEVKASSQDDYLLSTGSKSTIFKSRYIPAVYIKGLRVWYTSKIVNRLSLVYAITPCTLAYANIRPSSTEVREGLAYERFPALIEKCNNLIRCGTISGRILNIETVLAKEPESENCAILNLAMDPDQTAWRDNFHKVALQFLRVFYLPEQPATEEIFYKDIMPECIRRSKHNPKFKDFENLMDDCRLWLLKQDHSLRLLNAQTIEARYSSRTLDIDPHRTFIEGFELSPKVRYLRMYYVKDNPTHPDYMAPLLSHKTFVPIQKKRRLPESLASLMQRVEAWLRATGANVIGAETLPLVEQIYHDKGEYDGSVFRSEWLDGDSDYFQQTLLYVVRVYLDTVYPDPPLELMYPELGAEEECLIL